MNPRLRAGAIVAEPLRSLHNLDSASCSKRVDELFESVGLRPEQKHLFPHQFSGGQRQRIGIARALSTQPDLIICDEPVSALDVAVQAQILNLLGKLQKDFGLTYLFISHDLGVVQYMSDKVAVMYQGKIVEYGDRLSLFNTPRHPYTMSLLSSVPRMNGVSPVPPQAATTGDIPEQGCQFAHRCALVESRCREVSPSLRDIGGSHEVSCHLPIINHSR